MFSLRESCPLHSVRATFVMMNESEFRETIRARRRALGVSQRALAEIAGVSVHTVSDVESGRGNPTLSTIVQLLQPLGLELRVELRRIG